MVAWHGTQCHNHSRVDVKQRAVPPPPNTCSTQRGMACTLQHLLIHLQGPVCGGMWQRCAHMMVSHRKQGSNRRCHACMLLLCMAWPHHPPTHPHSQSIQERIDEQQQETHKVLEHNKLLAQENGLLKSQLGSTQEALEQLRTTQQDRISALAEQLQQQVWGSAGGATGLAVQLGQGGSRQSMLWVALCWGAGSCSCIITAAVYAFLAMPGTAEPSDACCSAMMHHPALLPHTLSFGWRRWLGPTTRCVLCCCRTRPWGRRPSCIRPWMPS